MANKGSPRTEAPSPKAKTKADSAKGSGSARGDNGKRASTPVVNKRGGKKGKTILDEKEADASVTKTGYMNATGQSSFLLDNIRTKQEWFWAQSNDIEGKLKTLVADVESRAKSCGQVAMDFLCGCSVETLKAAHSEEEVTTALTRIQECLHGPVAQLRAHIDKIGAMHTIMSQK